MLYVRKRERTSCGERRESKGGLNDSALVLRHALTHTLVRVSLPVSVSIGACVRIKEHPHVGYLVARVWGMMLLISCGVPLSSRVQHCPMTSRPPLDALRPCTRRPNPNRHGSVRGNRPVRQHKNAVSPRSLPTTLVSLSLCQPCLI